MRHGAVWRRRPSRRRTYWYFSRCFLINRNRYNIFEICAVPFYCTEFEILADIFWAVSHNILVHTESQNILEVIFWRCLLRRRCRRALFSLWRLTAVGENLSVIFVKPKNHKKANSDLWLDFAWSRQIFTFNGWNSSEKAMFPSIFVLVLARFHFQHQQNCVRRYILCPVINCYKNNRRFNLWILFIYKLFFDYSRRREFGPLIKLTNPMIHRNES